MSRRKTLKCQEVCKTVDDPSSHVAAQYKYWLPPKTQTWGIKVAKVSKTSSQHRILIYDSKETNARKEFFNNFKIWFKNTPGEVGYEKMETDASPKQLGHDKCPSFKN